MSINGLGPHTPKPGYRIRWIQQGAALAFRAPAAFVILMLLSALLIVPALLAGAKRSDPVTDLTLTDALPPEMAFVTIIDTSEFDAITVFNDTITGQIQIFGPDESAQLHVRGVLH